MTRAATLCLLLAGCGADGVSRSIALDVPPEGSEAYPFDGLTEITVSVARDGDELAQRVIPFGEPIELADIPFGEDLVIHLAGANATGEVAYGRTCALEVSEDEDTPVAPHLWFSRLVKWGAGPEPAEPARTGALAWAMPDGSAAFAGGTAGTAADAPRAITVERFDPLVGAVFGTLAVDLVARSGARLAAFPDGRAVIAGGVAPRGPGPEVDAVPTLELVNANAAVGDGRRYESVADGPRLRGHTLTALVDGRILIAGGEAQPSALAAFAVTGEASLLQIGEGDTLAPPSLLTSSLVTPRTEHTATRLSDEPGADVLLIGGRDAAGLPIGTVEVFRPLSDEFEEVASATMQVPRWGHVAVRLPGGFVLVLGGLTPGNLPVAEMELYDPVLGRFTAAGMLSSTAGLTQLTATPLPDGRVLLAGGRNAAGTSVATTLIAQLDPANGRVNIIATNSLLVPRAGHSAVPLCDGTVLLVGGNDDAPSERYNPPAAGRR